MSRQIYTFKTLVGSKLARWETVQAIMASRGSKTSNSPLPKGLSEPIASIAPDPVKVMRDKHIVRPHGKPWMTADTFMKILKDAAFQGSMDDLAGDLDKLLVGGEDMAM
jgi:hypothetical protein